MSRLLFVFSLAALLALAMSGPALASCITQTIFGPGGKMTICTTCCYGTSCTTTCT